MTQDSSNNWISLSSDDIHHYLSPTQLQALRQDHDPLPSILSDITAYIRQEIQSHPDNSLHHEPTSIPQSLRPQAAYLTIEALQSRFPQLKLSQDQVRNASNARLTLQRIASGKIKIAAPSSSTIQKIIPTNQQKRQATRKTLQGF